MIQQVHGSGKIIRIFFYIMSKYVIRGMYKDGDTSLVSNEWLETNVCRDHGPLGEAYPIYDGDDPWEKVEGIKEGDTPSFLYLIPNGLSDPMKPEWGNWGGRFRKVGPHYFDGRDKALCITDERSAVFRWRRAYQADFQARMDWCVRPYGQANHAPTVVLKNDAEQTVKQGEKVILNAEGSSDPDNDQLSYDWSFYKYPSSFKGELVIDNNKYSQASFIAPYVDLPATIHIVLTVTDNGIPALSSYKRVVINVVP